MTSFTITIAACVSLVPPLVSPVEGQTYTVGQEVLSVNFGSYTSSDSGYNPGTIIYTATSNLNGILPTSCVSIPTSTELTFEINCSDNTLAVDEIITITATDENLLFNNEETFTIDYTPHTFGLTESAEDLDFYLVIGALSESASKDFSIYTVTNSYAGALNI